MLGHVTRGFEERVVLLRTDGEDVPGFLGDGGGVAVPGLVLVDEQVPLVGVGPLWEHPFGLAQLLVQADLFAQGLC